MVFVVSERAKTNKGKKRNSLPQCQLSGHSYRFQLDDSKRCRYVCATCRTCDDKVKVRIVIRESVFSRNPDELEHVCRAKISSTKVIVTNRKVFNDHKAVVNLSPAIPSKIYRSVTDKCVVQYETEEEQHQVRLALPRLAQISRTLRRHNAKAKPQILNVRVIKAADPKAPDIKAYNKPWPRDIITLREGANEDNFFIVFEESPTFLKNLLLRGEPIRLRKPKYREAEQRLTEVPNSNIYDPEQNEEMENNDQIDENPIENDLNDNSELFDFMAQDFY
ncbi:hypothetical protein DdX_21178 [Ditylenchus destructor]|uniref:Uncharacterized protein n=1 Tax=Ditylenchus destructor TaxID=166010 RepID=A0AAD4QVY2_9BILA|nr:hypothetical protein DdX_21178 [Ditylenchus destructor]